MSPSVPPMSGVDHVSLTVTDLDRSERFYTEVLGMIRLLDVGYARILCHPATSLMIALATHEGAQGQRFTELATGLDHLGFAVGTREELVAWEQRLVDLGVEHTPIRDMEFGSHLNFRDPDHIALELSSPSDIQRAWLAELRERDVPREEIDRRIAAHLEAFHGSAE